MATNPIPEGFGTVTPYLAVTDAPKVIDFLKRAFGARERYVMRQPDGNVGHAELIIGDSMVMLTEGCEQMPASPVGLYLYVDDCDATYRQALAAGGTPLAAPEDQFYGDRMGSVRDGSGNRWMIATHREDVDDAELKRRLAARQAVAESGKQLAAT